MCLTKNMELNNSQLESSKTDYLNQSPSNIFLYGVIILIGMLLLGSLVGNWYFYQQYSEVKYQMSDLEDLIAKIQSEQDEKVNLTEMNKFPGLNPEIIISPTLIPTPQENSVFEGNLNINYFPIQWLSYSNQYQKVAQSFTLDKSLTTQKIKLKASFAVGSLITLGIFESGNVEDFIDGKLVSSGSIQAQKIVKEEVFEILLDKPAQLDAFKNYVFVVWVEDANTQTAIAFSEANIIENGIMFTYTRLIGGNGEILNDDHTWQPWNSQDVLYEFVAM